MTRSTAPMSMPSSRLDVATSAGRRPAFSSSSIATRCSRAMLAVVGADQLLAGELVEALGEALGEAAAVAEDDRGAVLRGRARGSAGWIAGQMLTRASGPAAGPPGCSSSGSGSPRRLRSSTGTTTWSSSGLRAPGVDDRDRRGPAPTPPRNRAIVSSGRCVADSPIRCGAAAGVRDEALEPLQAEGKVGAALRAGDRVDLVDDDVLDGPRASRAPGWSGGGTAIRAS